MAKRYEELTIADDFMFGKVMEDKKLCREVLECLLAHPVGELKDVQTERQFQYTTEGKPIRLDVYTRDRNHVYDAEMQNLNHQAVEKLCLRDGTEKIFYNCVSNAEEVPEHLKELYDYIRTGRAEGALTRKIEEAVGRARRNEEWRSEYMKELLHDDDVREEGRAEGRAAERNMLLTLIPRMTAGGDGDKIVQLENLEVMEAMQRKYDLDFANLSDSGKKL